MKLRHKLILNLLVGALLVCRAAFSETSAPFALITVPKAGSHLVMKALYFLTGSKPIWHTKFPSNQYIPVESGFLYTHFCLSSQLESDYKELLKLKKMIVIRDLRDVAISMVNQIKKNHWPGLGKEQRDYFLSLDLDEQLLFVINFQYDPYEVRAFAPNSLQVSLKAVASQAAEYHKKQEILTIRYEDLVGSLGGGSDDLQLSTLTQIKKFLSLDLTEDQIKEIATKLYGNQQNPFGKAGMKNFSSTFQKGKIGRWKDVFKPIHKQAFKDLLGKELIELGYEIDNTW